MKKITIIIVSIFFLIFSDLKAQQTEQADFKYTFINEYGLFFGSGDRISTIGLTGVFVNGVKIYNTHFVGIGIGYESDVVSGQSIPIFFNYRYFFPSVKRIKPFMNIAAGGRFSYWNSYDNMYGDIQKNAFGLYSTLAAGFNSYAFSLSSGFFVKSVGTRFMAGFEVKAGFTL